MFPPIARFSTGTCPSDSESLSNTSGTLLFSSYVRMGSGSG